MSSFKLRIEGEYETEEEAIKDMANQYMQCSKVDPPCESIYLALAGADTHSVDWRTLAKQVALYRYEEVYGIKQKVMIKILNIYPYNKGHWWQDTEGGKEFVKNLPRRRFKYEDVTKKVLAKKNK